MQRWLIEEVLKHLARIPFWAEPYWTLRTNWLPSQIWKNRLSETQAHFALCSTVIFINEHTRFHCGYPCQLIVFTMLRWQLYPQSLGFNFSLSPKHSCLLEFSSAISARSAFCGISPHWNQLHHIESFSTTQRVLVQVCLRNKHEKISHPLQTLVRK